MPPSYFMSSVSASSTTAIVSSTALPEENTWEFVDHDSKKKKAPPLEVASVKRVQPQHAERQPSQEDLETLSLIERVRTLSEAYLTIR